MLHTTAHIHYQDGWGHEGMTSYSHGWYWTGIISFVFMWSMHGFMHVSRARVLACSNGKHLQKTVQAQVCEC